MLKLIIFDMDGLIFDSEKLYMHFLQQVMIIYNYEFTNEQYINTLGLNDAATKIKMHELFGLAFEHQKIYSEAKQEMMLYVERENIPVKDGIIKLLNFLKKNNLKCCVASSTNRDDVLYLLKKAKIDQYFDFVVGGDEVKNSKPDPEIFLKACHKAHVKPTEAIVLEDSPNGLLAAINANISPICIPDLVLPPQEIASKCLAIVKNAKEVINIIKKSITL